MLYEDNYLAHHGIKGQRWGVRRFQNEDGTLTVEGRRRYGYTDTDTGTGNKKIEKYEEHTQTAVRNALDSNYWRKRAASEGKKNSEAYRNYAKLETGFARAALKKAKKLDKLSGQSKTDELIKQFEKDGVIYKKNKSQLSPSEAERYGVKSLDNTTKSETGFMRASIDILENKQTMKAIEDHIKRNEDQLSDLLSSAKAYGEISEKSEKAFQEYDAKLRKDMNIEYFDGDGSEEHLELKERYPEYAEIDKKDREAKLKLIDDVSKAVKSGRFDSIAEINKFPEFLSKWGGMIAKGDSQSFAIACALIAKSMGGEAKRYWGTLFPEDFIDLYDKDGKKVRNMYNS